MMERIAGTGRITVGADKGYDTKDFVQELRRHECDAACGAE